MPARPSHAEQTEDSQEFRFLRGFLASQRTRNPSDDLRSSAASKGDPSCALGVPPSCENTRTCPSTSKP